MESGKRSATAEGAALVRALHQVLDGEPRVLDDPIALRLFASQIEHQKVVARLVPFHRRLRANFALRSRYAEDCLAESMGDGLRQYVLLGAGLDTFAYRQPEWAAALRIFEVDHPATQEWKRAKLTAAGVAIPSNVSVVGVDFERDSLSECLAGAGLDSAAPTFFSSLGVTQYLTAESFDASLKFVLSMPRASEIVFSFVTSGADLSPWERMFGAMFAAIAGAGGEPWVTRYDPKQLAEKLATMGFSKVIHLSNEAANDRYFRGRRDGLRASRLEQMMRAIV
jgi:methyltransferase (TIGR00027 family)